MTAVSLFFRFRLPAVGVVVVAITDVGVPEFPHVGWFSAKILSALLIYIIITYNMPAL